MFDSVKHAGHFLFSQFTVDCCLQETIPAKSVATENQLKDVSVPANTDWRPHFKNSKPSNQSIEDTALSLNKAKQHRELINYLEAALLEGYSQPWMYGVLALSMRIEKYPQDEVERMLQSLVDLQPNDLEGLMYTAAMVVRFNADKLALNLYKEASLRSKIRPEPYVLGLKSAQKLQAEDDIIWAACGILTYDWTKGFASRHKLAENALLDLESKFKAQKQLERVDDLITKRKQAVVKDLHIRLDWTGNGELDLEVKEPSGQICSFANIMTDGGGILVHNGAGPNQNNSYEEYLCPQAISGVYVLTINHVWGDITGKRATLTIIQHKGTEQEVKTESIIILDAVVIKREIELKNGRRNASSERPVDKISLITPHTIISKNPRLVQYEMNQEQLKWLQRLQQRVPGNTPNNSAVTAVGYTPVINIIPEGVSVSAAAVISPDRRYVRLNIVPQFNTITDVFTFGFASFGNNN